MEWFYLDALEHVEVSVVSVTSDDTDPCGAALLDLKLQAEAAATRRGWDGQVLILNPWQSDVRDGQHTYTRSGTVFERVPCHSWVITHTIPHVPSPRPVMRLDGIRGEGGVVDGILSVVVQLPHRP